MTSKQKQFNPDKIPLLDDATVSYVFGEKPSFAQNIHYGVNALAEPIAETINKISSIKVGVDPEKIEAQVAKLDSKTGKKLAKRAIGTIQVAGLETLEREELSKKLSRFALIGGAAVAGAVETIPGLYEGMIGFIGVSMLNAVGDYKNLVLGSTIAGITAAGASGVEQMLAGTLIAGTIHRFKKTFKFWDRHKNEPTSQIKKDKSDLATGLVFGAPAAVLEQQLRDPDRELKQNFGLTASMSAKIFGINALLLSGMGVGLQELQKHGQDLPAEWIERIAGNPAAWIAGFGLYKYAKYKHEKKQERKHEEFVKLVNSPLPID